LRLAALDIGSNAVRLLIYEVSVKNQNEPVFNKLNLFRIPIRLGFDVFDTGYISKEKTDMLIETLMSFRHIINAYKVDHYKACATSAMREAKNAAQIIKLVKKETGLDIEVISGDYEASLIYENHIAENLTSGKSYMYIDVGGGSTEVSVFSNGGLAFYKSFNIGTIRLLKKKVSTSDWNEMRNAIKKETKNINSIISIGSGGNINKVFSMSKKKEGKPILISFLKGLHHEISSYSIEQRIDKFNLREDRADVIVPALLIYTNAMKWANSTEILVPKIGLADGLIHHLWEELK
jgi:exopolyphosphatase/guanosine-5'-triphosphate,3'-diphosphate pyrophosphatase